MHGNIRFTDERNLLQNLRGDNFVEFLTDNFMVMPKVAEIISQSFKHNHRGSAGRFAATRHHLGKLIFTNFAGAV